jgi:tetratricopeptide (TPR) repeat protein
MKEIDSGVGGPLKNVVQRYLGKLVSAPTVTFALLAVFSLFYWKFLANHSTPEALLVNLSLASFAVGCLAGFLFTSYGEESATVGKVRDWLIGGLAGLTIASFGSLKRFISIFATGREPQGFAIASSVAIIFVILGFFAMFLQRELILNVWLAESRDRRGRIEGTKLAGIVTHQLIAFLPPSLLSGIEDVDDDLAQSKEPEMRRIRTLLQSEGVRKFLSQCDESTVSGIALDWEVVSKAALLNYYLAYLAESDDRDSQETKALEWLERALIMNPGHADLTAKYADILARSGANDEAVITLERLDRSPEAPAYVRQWLGYYLLRIEGRSDEAVKYSEEYYARYPDEPATLYNAARGYMQIYLDARRLAATGDVEAEKAVEEFRNKALNRIKTALNKEPLSEQVDAKKWVKNLSDFVTLRSDADFIAMTQEAPDNKPPASE